MLQPGLKGWLQLRFDAQGPVVGLRELPAFYGILGGHDEGARQMGNVAGAKGVVVGEKSGGREGTQALQTRDKTLRAGDAGDRRYVLPLQAVEAAGTRGVIHRYEVFGLDAEKKTGWPVALRDGCGGIHEQGVGMEHGVRAFAQRAGREAMAIAQGTGAGEHQQTQAGLQGEVLETVIQ